MRTEAMYNATTIEVLMNEAFVDVLPMTQEARDAGILECISHHDCLNSIFFDNAARLGYFVSFMAREKKGLRFDLSPLKLVSQ